MSIREARLFGINNYPGFGNDLSGCVNDEKDWAKRIQERSYEFKKTLNSLATPKAYLAALDSLIEAGKKDDSRLVLQNSSHGTQVKDKDGDEQDGYDEALYLFGRSGTPTVTDDQIYSKVSKLNPKSRLLLICDSCFSGTMHRRAGRNRFLKTVQRLEKRLPVRRLFRSIKALPNVAILSACAEDETAADATIDGRPNGAFSYYALQVLAKNPGITFRAFRTEIGKLLPSREYNQTPQVVCPEAWEDEALFG
jgi:hypothetical protein